MCRVRQGFLVNGCGNRGLINMAGLRMPPGFATKGRPAPQYVAKSRSSQEQLRSVGLPQVIYQFWLAKRLQIKALAYHASPKARVFSVI
jgi:hypothetical protein